MDINEDDLSSPEIAALLTEHMRLIEEISPPESRHALDLAGLRQPDITFWSAWRNSELLGCGALKTLDAAHAEVKSMRTSTRHMREGIAAALLEYIVAQARQRGYRRLSLETGAQDYFEPARRLYTKFGFAYCGPFADYADDPNSVFMTKELNGNDR